MSATHNRSGAPPKFRFTRSGAGRASAFRFVVRNRFRRFTAVTASHATRIGAHPVVAPGRQLRPHPRRSIRRAVGLVNHPDHRPTGSGPRAAKPRLVASIRRRTRSGRLSEHRVQTRNLARYPPTSRKAPSWPVERNRPRLLLGCLALPQLAVLPPRLPKRLPFFMAPTVRQSPLFQACRPNPVSDPLTPWARTPSTATPGYARRAPGPPSAAGTPPSTEGCSCSSSVFPPKE